MLVKPNANNIGFDMPMEKPYDGAKPMYLIKNIDDREKLANMVLSTYAGIIKK